jgi:hypothetical protein
MPFDCSQTHVVLLALVEFHVDATMETGDLAFNGGQSILDSADAVTKSGDVGANLLETLHGHEGELFDRVDFRLPRFRCGHRISLYHGH